MIEGPIWSIGCGNMAGAMLRRWLQTGLDPAELTIVRKSGTPFAEGVAVLRAPPPDGAVPAMVLLGVKPQMIDDVAPMLADALAPETVLVSVLAGVELAALRARFPHPKVIVRAMPNTPVAIGQGVIGLCADGPVDRAAITAMMAPLGLVEWADESAFDAIAALAGSGPAFLFRFIDALGAAGADVGLDPEQARRMALATVAGAGLLAAGSDEDPDTLADRVASPGGSTRKGLDVLDRETGLRPLLREMLEAAVARNRELAAAART